MELIELLTIEEAGVDDSRLNFVSNCSNFSAPSCFRRCFNLFIAMKIAWRANFEQHPDASPRGWRVSLQSEITLLPKKRRTDFSLVRSNLTGSLTAAQCAEGRGNFKKRRAMSCAQKHSPKQYESGDRVK